MSFAWNRYLTLIIITFIYQTGHHVPNLDVVSVNNIVFMCSSTFWSDSVQKSYVYDTYNAFWRTQN